MDKISADEVPVADMLSALQENEDFTSPSPVIDGIPEVNEDMSEEQAQEYLRNLFGDSGDDSSSGGLLGGMFDEPVKSPSPVVPTEPAEPVVEPDSSGSGGVSGFPRLGGGKPSGAPSFPSLPSKGGSGAGGGFPQLPKLPPRG